MGGDASAITLNCQTAYLLMVGGNGDKKFISILSTVIILELLHFCHQFYIKKTKTKLNHSVYIPPLFVLVIFFIYRLADTVGYSGHVSSYKNILYLGVIVLTN